MAQMLLGKLSPLNWPIYNVDLYPVFFICCTLNRSPCETAEPSGTSSETVRAMGALVMQSRPLLCLEIKWRQQRRKADSIALGLKLTLKDMCFLSVSVAQHIISETCQIPFAFGPCFLFSVILGEPMSHIRHSLLWHLVFDLIITSRAVPKTTVCKEQKVLTPSPVMKQLFNNPIVLGGAAPFSAGTCVYSSLFSAAI